MKKTPTFKIFANTNKNITLGTTKNDYISRTSKDSEPNFMSRYFNVKKTTFKKQKYDVS